MRILKRISAEARRSEYAGGNRQRRRGGEEEYVRRREIYLLAIMGIDRNKAWRVNGININKKSL